MTNNQELSDETAAALLNRIKNQVENGGLGPDSVLTLARAYEIVESTRRMVQSSA